jgi:glycosidase
VKRLATLFAATLLAACGGGGGGSAPPPPTTNLPTPDVSAITAADPGSTLPDGWQHGAFMQVFVRSYQDSDGNGSGDLRGLTSRLDYLQDLGIKGLWLMPIARSQDRDHGYAVADYRDIEADYGSLADFDELLRQAHARGIGVTVDYVINHSAATNALFANARDSAANAYRDWYVWQPSAPSGWSVFGANPWRSTANGAYYAPFWDQMPDWNLANTSVVGYHESNLRFWLNRGVDGFRFDAVGLLFENGPSAWENQPQNYALMQRLRGMVEGYTRRTMVCEAPSDPRGFATACGSAFAFDLSASLIAAARGNDSAAVQRIAAFFAGSAAPSSATFLSNHDSFAGQRVADQLAGNVAQMKLAAAAHLLGPGRPFLYYGEEIGMAGAASLTGDPRLRTPMSWTADTARAGFTTGTPYRALAANVVTNNVAAQTTDANSLRAFYKAMLSLRNARPSIARGSVEGAAASGNVLSFQRVLGSERTLVVVNYGGATVNVVVGGLPAGATLTPLHPAGASGVVADGAGQATIPVAGQMVGVLGVQP